MNYKIKDEYLNKIVEVSVGNNTFKIDLSGYYTQKEMERYYNSDLFNIFFDKINEEYEEIEQIETLEETADISGECSEMGDIGDEDGFEINEDD